MLGNYKALWLLFLVPVVLVPIYFYCFEQKRRMLRVLASIDMLGKINQQVSFGKQLFKTFLCVAAFVMIVVGLAQPKWNPRPEKIKQIGRDVCLIIDTSRSMLADDVKPSRLSRVKEMANELIKNISGDRIAVVTFAGSNAVKCPLTNDYFFVRTVVDQLDTEATSLGGTMIGDALRKSIDEVFDKQSREYKDVILFTDGEEHEGYNSFAMRAAQKASENGIRILVIGMGDDVQGGRIPIVSEYGSKSFLEYDGEHVWTKLNENMLVEIANSCRDGKYLPVKPGYQFDFMDIYNTFSLQAERREIGSVTMTKYDEKFQILLAFGLILLICEVLISERKKV